MTSLMCWRVGLLTTSNVNVRLGPSIVGLFAALVRDAILEVIRRDPNHFVGNPLFLPRAEEYMPGLSTHMQGCAPKSLGTAVERCMNVITGLGITARFSTEPCGPIGETIVASALDGLDAERGRLRLMPVTGDRPRLSEALKRGYKEYALPSGCRYFVRQRGARPLVVINATGISGTVWTRFIADQSHDLRLMVVESAATDYVSGGMRRMATINTDMDDVRDAVRRQGWSRYDCVAWCNGARVALALASYDSERLESLVLLSPSLRDTRMQRPGSVFEESTHKMFAVIRAQPDAATSFAQLLSSDHLTFASRPLDDRYAQECHLLSLPTQDMRGDLIVPMQTPSSLRLYADRGASDQEYRCDPFIDGHKHKIMVVSGYHDTVTNNDTTRAWVRSREQHICYATIYGASHYIQDSQYQYFRWLIDTFLSPRQAAEEPCARVRKERLAAEQLPNTVSA